MGKGDTSEDERGFVSLANAPAGVLEILEQLDYSDMARTNKLPAAFRGLDDPVRSPSTLNNCEVFIKNRTGIYYKVHFTHPGASTGEALPATDMNGNVWLNPNRPRYDAPADIRGRTLYGDMAHEIGHILWNRSSTWQRMLSDAGLGETESKLDPKEFPPYLRRHLRHLYNIVLDGNSELRTYALKPQLFGYIKESNRHLELGCFALNPEEIVAWNNEFGDPEPDERKREAYARNVRTLSEQQILGSQAFSSILYQALPDREVPRAALHPKVEAALNDCIPYIDQGLLGDDNVAYDATKQIFKVLRDHNLLSPLPPGSEPLSFAKANDAHGSAGGQQVSLEELLKKGGKIMLVQQKGKPGGTPQPPPPPVAPPPGAAGSESEPGESGESGESGSGSGSEQGAKGEAGAEGSGSKGAGEKGEQSSDGGKDGEGSAQAGSAAPKPAPGAGADAPLPEPAASSAGSGSGSEEEAVSSASNARPEQGATKGRLASKQRKDKDIGDNDRPTSAGGAQEAGTEGPEGTNPAGSKEGTSSGDGSDGTTSETGSAQKGEAGSDVTPGAGKSEAESALEAALKELTQQHEAAAAALGKTVTAQIGAAQKDNERRAKELVHLFGGAGSKSVAWPQPVGNQRDRMRTTERQMRKEIHKLSTRLLTVLDEGTGVQRRLDSGMIDTDILPDSATGKKDIFMDYVPKRDMSMAISILCDLSASMEDVKHDVERTATLVALAAKKAHIANDVWGFGARVGSTQVPFKYYKETTYERLGSISSNVGGGTPMLEAVLLADKRLRARPEKTRALFLVTDGAPTDDDGRGTLRRITDDLVADGIPVYAVYVGPVQQAEALKRFFTHYTAAANMQVAYEQMVKKMIALMEKASGRRRSRY